MSRLLSNRNTRTQAVAYHNLLDSQNSYTASKQAAALHSLPAVEVLCCHGFTTRKGKCEE